MLRVLAGTFAAALLALPLANGQNKKYCSCTKLFPDESSSTEKEYTPSTAGLTRETSSGHCEVMSTKTCYPTLYPTSCPNGGDDNCLYSQACFAALGAGQACTAKFFTLRFNQKSTKSQTTELTDTKLSNLRKAVQKALDAKLNPGYDVTTAATTRETLAKLKFYVDADTEPSRKSGYPRTTKSSGRRRLEMEEEAIELDIIEEEEETIPRGRRLLAYGRKSSKSSPTRKPTSRSSSKKQYTYVKVEIQGPWGGGGINQKDMETLITKTTKDQMNCCKSVTFYKICSGHNCKSETCDEGPDCKSDSDGGWVIIVIIVVLVCCCCCVAAGVGAYFYMNQKNDNLNQEMETHNEQNTSPRGETGAGAPTNTATQGGPEEAI